MEKPVLRTLNCLLWARARSGRCTLCAISHRFCPVLPSGIELHAATGPSRSCWTLVCRHIPASDAPCFVMFELVTLGSWFA